MKSSRLIAFFAGAALVGCGGSRSSGLKDIAVGKFVSGVPVTITIGASEASELNKVAASEFAGIEYQLAQLNIEADEHKIDADQFWSINRTPGEKSLPTYAATEQIDSDVGSFFGPIISFPLINDTTGSFVPSAQFKIIDSVSLQSLSNRIKIDAQIVFSTSRNSAPTRFGVETEVTLIPFCSSQTAAIGKSADIPNRGDNYLHGIPSLHSLEVGRFGQKIRLSRFGHWATNTVGFQTEFFDPKECKTDLKILFYLDVESQKFAFHGLTYTLLTEKP